MAPLSPRSKAAIARLREYVSPPTSYDKVPVSRRAAVLLLLYADAQGELRVVLTIRSKNLSSYAGHAALPGGKADSGEETPFETARREAYEEIGLPDIGQPMPPPFTIEHLCELPTSLAATAQVVRPCVAFLHSRDDKTGQDADPLVFPVVRLDAKEVESAFTAPLHNFLKRYDEQPVSDKPEEWYSGSWTSFHGTPFRMHNFFVPLPPKVGTKPQFTPRMQHKSRECVGGQQKSVKIKRNRVFGLTARILVDAARVAYAEEPEIEHSHHMGDEDLIVTVRERGVLDDIPKLAGTQRVPLQNRARLS